MDATALHSGTVVGDRYTVEGLIGEGGMAMVFRVRHNALGTYHALKVLTLASASIRERLRREGQLQASLRHPNIVAVTDVVEIGSSYGLVLELVDGPNLDALIGARRLSFDEIDLLVPGILAAVAAAHERGYVHRDLKPANILLARTEGGLLPKIADFGLAKVVDGSDGGSTRTRTGSTMGTPHYMSPEQIRDTSRVGPPSDVFALGCILYEMVTGRRAFDGPDLLDIFNAVANAAYAPVREIAPDAPERMVEAIGAALAVDPAARPTVVDLAGIWGADLTVLRAVTLSSPSLPSLPAPVDSAETWRGETVADEPAASVGSVDPELPATSPTLAPSVPGRSRAVWALGLGGSLVALAASAAVVLGVGIGVGWWLGSGPDVVSGPVEPAPRGIVAPHEGDAIEPVEPDPPAEPGALAPFGDRDPAPPVGPAEMASEPDGRPSDPIPEVPLPSEASLSDDPEPEGPGAEDAEVPIEAKVAAPVPSPEEPEAFGMLASKDPRERIVAAKNLAKRFAEPDAIHHLNRLARQDPDRGVRLAAFELALALYLDGHGDFEPPVIWVMDRGPEPLALRAVEAYQKRGADPKQLGGALRHSSPKVRRAALDALLTVAPRAPEGVEIDYEAMLGPLLESEQVPAVRRRAAEVERELVAD